MSHVFRTINRYHKEFESYEGVITLKSLLFWVSVFSVALFSYSFSWYLNMELWPKAPIKQEHRIFVVMGFEVVTLVCWFRLQAVRNKMIVAKVQCLLGVKEKDILKLKKIWIEATLGLPSTKFLDVAMNIDSLLNLKARNKSPLSLDSKRVWGFIFTVDSKNRILAIFMGICAAVVGLSISAGSSLSDVFVFYEKESVVSLFIITAIASIFLMISYLFFWYIGLVVVTILGDFFNKFDGLNGSSNRRARNFIYQLVVLHELPKGRIK